MTERYGAIKITKLRAAVNELRAAIQSEGTPRIEAAWERAENWVDRIFRTEAPMEWRDIATAPKDGQCIFVFLPSEMERGFFPINPRKARWLSDLGEWAVDSMMSSEPPQPTRWMPLPAPPTEGK